MSGLAFLTMARVGIGNTCSWIIDIPVAARRRKDGKPVIMPRKVVCFISDHQPRFHPKKPVLQQLLRYLDLYRIGKSDISKVRVRIVSVSFPKSSSAGNGVMLI